MKKSLAEATMPEELINMLGKEEEICPICEGEGVVPVDEWDENSKCYQAGVGSEPCECQEK
jgi:hypothetical protein